MALSRVSTAFAFATAGADLMRAQARQIEAQNHVSSSKKAVDLQGFGRSSETIIAARTVQSRAANFVDQHKLLEGELSAQDLALLRVSDAAEQANGLILHAISSGQAESLVKTLDSLFSQASDALNWKHEGRYLFAGAQVDVPPVAVDSLAELVAAPSTASVFRNDDTQTESRLNESSTLRTGFLASTVATELFDILKSVQQFHTGPSGPLTGRLTDVQIDFLKTKVAELAPAQERLLDRVAENGLMQQRVADAKNSQQRRVDQLTAFIGEITDVDVAEAYTRLTQAQLAVQASSQALRALQGSSLLNFMD